MKKTKYIRKSFSLLLSLIMLLSIFTLTGTYAEEETPVSDTPSDEMQEETEVNEDSSDNDAYPDGTRTVYHYFIAAYSDGDLLTYNTLGSYLNETRYSDGNSNNHKNQKWEWSYNSTGYYYTLFPLGGENPYALTVNPTTLAVTVESYYSTNVYQRWEVVPLWDGRLYFVSRATGTAVNGYKLVVNGSSVTVSNTSYTEFFVVDYDTYVGSTSLSYSNFYLAPQSSRTITPQNQAGINVPDGATVITASNSNVSVSFKTITGNTGNTSATLTFTDKLTNAHGTCTVYVTPIKNGTYYLKNKQTGCFARVKNGSMANGTNAVQYAFDGTNYEKWQFSLNQTTGYYTIKSKGSSTAYYLTVKNSVSTLNQEIVLGTSSTANGAQWRVAITSSGAYKLTPKTGENAGGSGVDYVLATNTSANTNNANLIQGKYVLNTSYRDEWYILRTDKKFSQITLYNDSSISTTTLHDNICQYYNQNAHINGNCITSITEANYVNELKTNDYLCTITHGGETENKLKINSTEVLYLSELNSEPSSDFSGVKLIILSSCYSGRTGGTSFVDTLRSKGVDIVIGFKGDVEQNTCVYWTRQCIKYITLGYTVYNAINQAKSDLQVEYSGTIYESVISLITNGIYYGNYNVNVTLF